MKCERCQQAFTPGRRGRPPRFCSVRCQQAAWRIRNAIEWRAYFAGLARRLNGVRVQRP